MAETGKKLTLKEIMATDRYKQLLAERKELQRLAIPLYKERLKSSPYFQARMSNEHFWKAYIGSRVTEARYFVAQSLEKDKAG